MCSAGIIIICTHNNYMHNFNNNFYYVQRRSVLTLARTIDRVYNDCMCNSVVWSCVILFLVVWSMWLWLDLCELMYRDCNRIMDLYVCSLLCFARPPVCLYLSVYKYVRVLNWKEVVFEELVYILIFNFDRLQWSLIITDHGIMQSEILRLQ